MIHVHIQVVRYCVCMYIVSNTSQTSNDWPGRLNWFASILNRFSASPYICIPLCACVAGHDYSKVVGNHVSSFI